MFPLFLLVWGPILVAVGIAVTLRLTLLRGMPRLPTRDAALAAIAGGLPFLVTLIPLLDAFGPPVWPWPELGGRAALPLALGLLGVILLALPARPVRPNASAQLTPRTIRMFVPLQQPATLAGLVTLSLALALAAGAASVVDELGRHTMFTISLGTTGTEASSRIYGWYYSFPSLCLLAALLLAAALAWVRIPRPAWSGDIDRDTALRRNRAGNISRVACGAVLLHLAVVLGSLAGTASMMLSAQAGNIGIVSLGTPFAAMGPLLSVAQAIATVAGSALWLLTALTALPLGAQRRAGVPVP